MKRRSRLHTLRCHSARQPMIGAAVIVVIADARALRGVECDRTETAQARPALAAAHLAGVKARQKSKRVMPCRFGQGVVAEIVATGWQKRTIQPDR